MLRGVDILATPSSDARPKGRTSCSTIVRAPRITKDGATVAKKSKSRSRTWRADGARSRSQVGRRGRDGNREFGLRSSVKRKSVAAA